MSNVANEAAKDIFSKTFVYFELYLHCCVFQGWKLINKEFTEGAAKHIVPFPQKLALP